MHRVFRDARQTNQRDAAELISIQPLDYEQWLAAWSGNEGEDPFSSGAATAATAEAGADSASPATASSTTICCVCMDITEFSLVCRAEIEPASASFIGAAKT